MQLTVRDVSRMLSVSEQTVYRWIKQGALPAYRVGDQYRFNRAELFEWATSKKLPISPEVFDEGDAGRSPLPALSEALEAGGIFRGVGGPDKPSVLQAVVRAIDLPKEIDRQFLYQVLLARESLGSTGIGDGIAIPHVRNPIVLHLPRPLLTLCFLDHPIDFGSIDGKPVDTLFMLISPTVRAHLHMLSRLGMVLRDSGFKAALNRKAPNEEIVATVRQAESALSPAGGGRQDR